MIRKIYNYFYSKNTFDMEKQDLLENGFTLEDLEKLRAQGIIRYNQDVVNLNKIASSFIFSDVYKDEGKKIILYDYLYDTNKKVFTKEELLNIGYTEDEINNLYARSIIKNDENGDYMLRANTDFCTYSIIITPIDEQKKLDDLLFDYDFYSSYKINKMFSRFVVGNDYSNVVKMLRIIVMNSTDDFSISNNNMLIYLLCNITDNLYEFTDYCRDFSFYSIKSEKDLESPYYSDKIRGLIYDRKFSVALKELKDYSNPVFKSLISRAQNKKSNDMKKLHEYIDCEEWDKILNYYNNQARRFKLLKYEELIIHIVKEIRKMEMTNKLPKVGKPSDDSFSSKIYSNDFRNVGDMSENMLGTLVKAAIRKMDIIEGKIEEQEEGININKIFDLIKSDNYDAYSLSEEFENVSHYDYTIIIDELFELKNIDMELFEYLCKVVRENNIEEINWCLDEIWKDITEVSENTIHFLEDNIFEKEEIREDIETTYNRIKESEDVEILSPGSIEDAIKIYEEAKKYDNLIVFLVENDDKKKLVMFYNFLEFAIDEVNVYSEALTKYINKEYKECIDVLRFLICNSPQNDNYYEMIGKCYYYLGDDEQSIKYFTIANCLTDKIDYTELIDRIKSKEKGIDFTYTSNN